MLDIGWMELLVIGVVALLVVGPKELPALLRTIGRFIGMAKRQADEFRAQFDEAIRESEFEDIRREMDDIRRGRFDADDTGKVDPKAETDGKNDPAAAPSRETDVNAEDRSPIEPAPEFRDDKPTTSFTMADGTVVTKQEAEPDAKAPDAADRDAAGQSDETPPKRDAETVR